MPRHPASLWDYVSVMYRDVPPTDPREWPLCTRFLVNPRHLIRAASAGNWRRAPRFARLWLALGAVFYIAALLCLLAIIPLALTGFGVLGQLDDTGRFWLRIAIAIQFPLLSSWPIAWAAWIAIGGADRATAVLRRQRTRIVHAPPDADPYLPRELAARRTHWRAEIAGWPNRRFKQHRQWIDPEFAAIFSAVLAAAFFGLFLAAFDDFRFIAILYAALISLTLCGRRRRKQLQRRLFDALDAVACPDCAYSLLGLPGRPADADLPAWPGPRRCPECGSPWPALPPPVPAEHQGRFGRALGEALRPILSVGTNTGTRATADRPASPPR